MVTLTNSVEGWFGTDAEEHLSFFAKVIAGRETRVSIEEDQHIHANVEQKKIVLSSLPFVQIEDAVEARRAIIAAVLHEAAHIRFSGVLHHAQHQPQHQLLCTILNVIEDVRIETHLCTAYPQARSMLVNEFVRVANRLAERNVHNEDVLVAIRFLLENKAAQVPVSTNAAFKQILLWVEREAYLRQIWSGTWNDAVEFAKELLIELHKHGLSEAASAVAPCRVTPSRELFEQSGFDAALSREQLKYITAHYLSGEDAAAVAASPGVSGTLHAAMKELFVQREGSRVLVRSMPMEEGIRADAPMHVLPSEHSAVRQGQQAASDLKHRLRINKVLATGRRAGALDMRAVRRALKRDAPLQRVFAKRERHANHKHSVCVLLDSSGSMYTGASYGRAYGSNEKMLWALQAIKMIDEALGNLPEVDYSIRAFSATSELLRINDLIIKDFGKTNTISWDRLRRIHVLSRDSKYEGQNRDGDSIRHAAELLAQRSGKKLLIVVSDGEPHHGGTQYYGKEAIRDTQHAVRDAEAAGIVVFGIAIDAGANLAVRAIYGNHAAICTESTLQNLGAMVVDIYVEKMQSV